MCACMCMCECVHTHGGQGGLGCDFSGDTHLSFDSGVSHWLGIHQAWPANSRALLASASPALGLQTQAIITIMILRVVFNILN